MISVPDKKIAVLTRDCAGVNATVRSLVRTANKYNIGVLGFLKGYDGLIDNKFIKLDRRSVSGIINQGGTILKTARSKRFFIESEQKKAVQNIKDNKVQGLIVIGGDGSLRGAHILASKYNIPVVGIPATIDNDVNGVDLSIGADTAVNVALDALDKIRDTATSLERIFVVEVMGRECGYIALQVALAGGCEEVLIPEKDFNIEAMSEGYYGFGNWEVQKVEYYIDNTLKATITKEPYLWDWTEKNFGEHTIKVIAYGYNNDTSMKEIQVTKIL